jgi:hypothetical protein
MDFCPQSREIGAQTEEKGGSLPIRPLTSSLPILELPPHPDGKLHLACQISRTRITESIERGLKQV